jgi:hypothetical protein
LPSRRRALRQAGGRRAAFRAAQRARPPFRAPSHARAHANRYSALTRSPSEDARRSAISASSAAAARSSRCSRAALRLQSSAVERGMRSSRAEKPRCRCDKAQGGERWAPVCHETSRVLRWDGDRAPLPRRTAPRRTPRQPRASRRQAFCQRGCSYLWAVGLTGTSPASTSCTAIS